MLRLRKYFITGILVLLPLYISIYILVVIFRLFDGILGKLINSSVKDLFGVYVPGLGLILFVLLILLTGFLSIHILGRSRQKLMDKALSSFPLLRYIYPSVKQIFEFLFSDRTAAFKKAVLVEYPCPGAWSLGFITNEHFNQASQQVKQDLVNVYIPFAPNPASGFYALIPRAKLTLLDISIADAMKLVISAGLLTPPDPAADKDTRKNQ